MYRLKAIEADEPYESPNHEDAPEDEAEDAASGESEDHRTLDFSCSSEAPVSRWFGEEILDHNAGSIDLSRFASRANILWNHNSDCPIGVIEKAWVQNKRLYVKARFSRNEKAREVLDDIRDGILTNVSIGYACHEMRLEVERDTGNDTYRITRWTPMEVSIVTVPADYTVGIGRSANQNQEYPVTITRQNAPDIVESIDLIAEQPSVNAVELKGETMTQEDIEKMVRGMLEAQSVPKEEPKVESKSVEDANQLLAQERERCANITALGEHMGNMELAQKLIESGATLGEANRQFLALQQSRANEPKPLASPMTTPMVNTRLNSNRDHISGMVRELEDRLDSVARKVWTEKKTGYQVIQRDHRPIDDFVRANREVLSVEMEEFAKRNGLLSGVQERAQTQKTDIPVLLLDYLSSFVRETHTAKAVWWQFAFRELELGKGPGETIRISRDKDLPDPVSEADYELTPGTNITDDRQPISVGDVSLTLKEYGLGKNGVANGRPVAIPAFWAAYSMRNLEDIVSRNLGRNYEKWVDLSIRSKYALTSRVVYNKRGTVTTDPLQVGTGDNGSITETFLNDLYAYMAGTLQMPCDDTNCLYLVLHPRGVVQLKNSLGERQMYIAWSNLEELTNMMKAANNNNMVSVQGYVGTVCNFHIFQSNSSAIGGAGSEGVQTETLGVGARLTRTAYAFAPYAVARAIGLDVEIRQGEFRDFGRSGSFIWYTQQRTGPIDVDPAINAEQQLRVVAVRTVDIPV